MAAAKFAKQMLHSARSRPFPPPFVGRYISNGANKQYLSFKVLPLELFVATISGLR
jgi:hypothetical protein